MTLDPLIPIFILVLLFLFFVAFLYLLATSALSDKAIDYCAGFLNSRENLQVNFDNEMTYLKGLNESYRESYLVGALVLNWTTQADRFGSIWIGENLCFPNKEEPPVFKFARELGKPFKSVLKEIELEDTDLRKMVKERISLQKGYEICGGELKRKRNEFILEAPLV